MISSDMKPPYYAVIFTSQRTDVAEGYDDTADRMAALAAQQPGYLGVDSARGVDGLGITVSYWESLEAIAAWRKQAEHQLARGRGRTEWYRRYDLRIAKVERAYSWAREDGLSDPVAP